ncbi:MAG: MFS transporter, partial [Alphaproteobacteria bacterium]|nr:MFS transporter [Alphaproteobacteria bacterium]
MPESAAEIELGVVGRPAQSRVSEFSRARRVWTTTMLAVVAFLAATDRNILAVLLVPIQKDLGVSDAAMGALTGTAYALVYATAALPLAWLADRVNRRNLLAVSLAAWSAMTALCGFASTYLQLLFARFGVAGSEAVQNPTSLSMLADIYPAERRGTAISVVTIGSALGFSVGAYLAGFLNDRYGWHVAMMAVGLPGLMAALAILWTVPEPQRGMQDSGQDAPSPAGIVESAKKLAQIRTLLPLMVGMIFLSAAFLGWLNWAPTFLMRIHQLSMTQMSAVFGAIVGVGGVLSNLIAGIASDRLARWGLRWRMYYCCAMCIASAPALAASLLIHSTQVAIALMVLYSLSAGGLTTVTAASAISIAPTDLRASVMAVAGFTISVFGGGVGPFVIGWLNDSLHARLGSGALRYTLLCAPLSLIVAATLFFVASRSIELDAA